MNYVTDNRLRAEFFGTLCLVLIGCSAIVLSNFPGAPIIGFLPISMAFGMTVAAMAYAVGPVSGCHLNPAVTAAMWSAGRIKSADAIAYVVAQFIGAIVGSLILLLITKGKVSTGGITALGQTTWSDYGMVSAIIAEFVGTVIFTLVILAVTGPRGGVIGGLIVGITLMIIHFAFINVSGASVNPARSFAPAIFVGGTALAQVWMYLIIPTLGGLVAGFLVKSKTLDL